MKPGQFKKVRYRQVHLDFHTSGEIEGVGRDFSEEQFIACLKKGHVDTVNVFATCHHGWAYYDSAVAPPHPHLEANLLPRMLKACADNDIEAPVYISVGYNEVMALEHPEWVLVNPDGTRRAPDLTDPDAPRPIGSWHMLCLNTPYLDYILDLTREVMERFRPVGLWYDIMGEYPCICEYCRKSMYEKGLDYQNAADLKKHTKTVFLQYLKSTTDLVWGIDPKTRVFHNDCTRKMGTDDYFAYYSHYDIESLSSWGFDVFSLKARYFIPKGFDCVGMTAKFHKDWGEFGGFKTSVAMKHEAARIIAAGAKCCFGDQLHPSGRMDEETYRLIGEAYADVERREPWCEGREPMADIGVLIPTIYEDDNEHRLSDYGAFAVLREGGLVFDIIDPGMDFSKYRLLILPDAVRVTEPLKVKIDAFLAAGGSLLLSFESGLWAGRDAFAFDLGADWAGKSPWETDFTVAGELVSESMVRSPYLNYERGAVVRPRDCDVLATALRPYFNRTNARFCSHQNTPYSGDAGYPSAIRKGKIVYIAHPVFRIYRANGLYLHRNLALNCVRLLLRAPLVGGKLPTGCLINLSRFSGSGSYILDIVYESPMVRGDTMVVEDMPVFRNIDIRLNIGIHATSVSLLPDQQQLDFNMDGGGVCFRIPELSGHCMVLVSAD